MSSTGRIKVMVADDHSVFRRGMRELLADDEQMEVVSEAAAGDEAVEKARQFKPDVVVMDVRMPRMNGIEATRKIKEDRPQTEVVVVSAVEDEDMILEAIEAGASGYLGKDNEPEVVLQAIHNASEGKGYLPPHIAKRVLDRFAQDLAAKPQRRGRAELTQRETSVLRLLVAGSRNREIAAKLGISERTVGNHIANIYSKLHIQDRAQAILYAVRKGIVKI